MKELPLKWSGKFSKYTVDTGVVGVGGCLDTEVPRGIRTLPIFLMYGDVPDGIGTIAYTSDFGGHIAVDMNAVQ